jgi:subtilisin family serine protease
VEKYICITGAGIDYQNPIFQNNDGTSRIESIWDQTISQGPAPFYFNYGAEYRVEQMNQALKSENPQDIVPSIDTNGHGTYVASLATGSRVLENDFSGAAPYSKIAMVKLKEAKNYLKEFFFIGDDAPVFQGNDVMAALEYLHLVAEELDLPLVVCFALGTNTGRHTGVSMISGMMDEIVSNKGRAVVIATGNEAAKRHHFYGNIENVDDSEKIEIYVGSEVKGFTLEFWGDIPNIFSVEIVSPTGERLERSYGLENTSLSYNFLFESTTVTVDYRISVADNGSQLIFMRFVTPSEGIWNVVVYLDNGLAGGYNMWLPLQIQMTGEVYFIRSNPDTTLTIPSTARLPITVGGYDHHNDSIYLDSGRGYTPAGAIKPDFVAPAVDVIGADLNNQFVARSGTSAAAAITAGAVALLMEWAVVRGNFPTITASNFKTILIRGAKRSNNVLYPNRQWGYGILDLYQAFDGIRNL